MVIAYCFTCNKEHDVSSLSPTQCNVKCECGGYVISPSGKSKMRFIEDKIKVGAADEITDM